MSGKKSKRNYRAVEARDLGEFRQSLKNPFLVVGDARPSHTGLSLAMRIKHSDGKIHHYTLLKKDIERVFLSQDIEIITAPIREYFNELNED